MKSPTFTKKGVINAVIMAIIPINGNKNALTTPASTPTLTITIENSPLGAASVKAERSDFGFGCLSIIFPSKFPPSFIPSATAISAIAMKNVVF